MAEKKRKKRRRRRKKQRSVEDSSSATNVQPGTHEEKEVEEEGRKGENVFFSSSFSQLFLSFFLHPSHTYSFLPFPLVLQHGLAEKNGGEMDHCRLFPLKPSFYLVVRCNFRASSLFLPPPPFALL